MADKSRTNRKSLLGVGLAFLMTLMILLPGASTTSAQSTGGFGGAILELVPTGNTISGITLSTPTNPTGSTFYIEGIVYRNRTVSRTCTISDLGKTPVAEDQDGGIVGRWRLWGVRTAGPAPTSGVGQPLSNSGISGGNVAVVNMSVELEGFNGTLQFQGTLGRVFGAIESSATVVSDTLAITGGTGTFRSASGDGVLDRMPARTFKTARRRLAPRFCPCFCPCF